MSVDWNNASFLVVEWSGCSETKKGWEGNLTVARPTLWETSLLCVRADSEAECLAASASALRSVKFDCLFPVDPTITEDTVQWVHAVASSVSDAPTLPSKQVRLLI